MTHTWLPTGPASVRGTVVVLPGRGEHGGVYERFGRRLAYDAYAVHALDIAPHDPAETVRELVAKIAADAVGPVVLAGSDTGALHALRVATAGEGSISGLILVGLLSASASSSPAFSDPDSAGSGSAGEDSGGSDQDAWDRELEIRTACPTHRARLTGDAAFERGALTAPVPADLLATLADDALDGLAVPALVLHGAEDPVAPLSAARALAARLPAAELAVARTPAHDVLNDAIHRTIAAHVVQWLERLRDGGSGGLPLDVTRPAPVREPAGAA